MSREWIEKTFQKVLAAALRGVAKSIQERARQARPEASEALLYMAEALEIEADILGGKEST